MCPWIGLDFGFEKIHGFGFGLGFVFRYGFKSKSENPNPHISNWNNILWEALSGEFIVWAPFSA